MEVLSMKSPKNIVKAFMLTSLIVSPVLASDDVATGAAKAGFFRGCYDYVVNAAQNNPKTAKVLAVGAGLGILGYGAYRAYRYFKPAVNPAVNPPVEGVNADAHVEAFKAAQRAAEAQRAREEAQRRANANVVTNGTVTATNTVTETSAEIHHFSGQGTPESRAELAKNLKQKETPAKATHYFPGQGTKASRKALAEITRLKRQQNGQPTSNACPTGNCR